MRQRRRLTVIILLLTLAVACVVFVVVRAATSPQPVSLLTTGVRETNGLGIYEAFMVSNTTSRALVLHFVSEYRTNQSAHYRILPAGAGLELGPSQSMVLSFPVPSTPAYWRVAAYSFRPRRNLFHEVVDRTFRKLRSPAPGSASSYSEEFHTLKP